MFVPIKNKTKQIVWLARLPGIKYPQVTLGRNLIYNLFLIFFTQRRYFRCQKNQFIPRQKLWLAHTSGNGRLLGSQRILYASYLNMFADVKYTVTFGNSFVLFRWLWNIIQGECWAFLVFEIKLENEGRREFYAALEQGLLALCGNQEKRVMLQKCTKAAI